MRSSIQKCNRSILVDWLEDCNDVVSIEAIDRYLVSLYRVYGQVTGTFMNWVQLCLRDQETHQFEYPKNILKIAKTLSNLYTNRRI